MLIERFVPSVGYIKVQDQKTAVTHKITPNSKVQTTGVVSTIEVLCPPKFSTLHDNATHTYHFFVKKAKKAK